MLDPKIELRGNRPLPWSLKGFTLLEILVALFIFSIVMTTIFGSFNMVIGNAGDIELKASNYEMGKICLNRIISDIRLLYLPLGPLYSPPEFTDEPDPNRLLGEKTVINGVDFSTLLFTANAHLPFEGSTITGIARIGYYVQYTSDENFVLKRSDKLFPSDIFEQDPNDPIICENLKALSFFYYTEDGQEFDYWDSDSTEFGYASPSALKIVLKLGSEADEIGLETMIILPVVREKRGA